MTTLNFVQPISVTSSAAVMRQQQQQARHGLSTTTLKRNRCPATTTRTASTTIPQATLLTKEADTLTSTKTSTTSTAYTTVNPFETEATDVISRPSSSSSSSSSSQRRKPSKSSSSSVNPIVIIPGFGASHLEYLALESHLQTSLLQTNNNNIYTKVVPVTKRDWALSLNGRPMTRILRMIDDAVQAARLACTGGSDSPTSSSNKNVTLVGHSAGGWIARVYLGHQQYHGYEYNGRHHVDQLICLGTPHDSGEPVTRNNMRFVNTHYPGAFYDDVEYFNFAGDGAMVVPRDVPSWMIWHPLWMPKLSYKLTDPDIRDDEVMPGDGIVPLTCTFLDGASANVRLEGVWHSSDSKGPWYGDEKVVRYWSRFIK